MSILRKDLFPKLEDNIFFTGENTINGWVRLAFEAFSSLFASEEEFVKYINSIKDSRDAELFIRLGDFHLIAKKYEVSIFSKLIMIISIIERLQSKEEFIPFQDWILARKQNDRIEKYLQSSEGSDLDRFKNTINLLTGDYYNIFGSQRNVVTFFKDYVSIEDKIKMIKSFRGKWTDYVEDFSIRIYGNTTSKVEKIEELSGTPYYCRITKGLMPYCYEWKYCLVSYDECNPDTGCLLKEKEELLEEALKKIIGLIYQIRSNAVHNAVFPAIGEGDVDSVSTIIDNKYVMIEIRIEDLQNIFEKGFKACFDKIVIK